MSRVVVANIVSMHGSRQSKHGKQSKQSKQQDRTRKSVDEQCDEALGELRV